MKTKNKMKDTKWYLDNGYSRHMTRNASLLASFKSTKEDDYVTFGDNKKDKLLRVGNVGKTPIPTIDEVLLITGLKFNLMGVSQLCDKGFKVLFCKESCTILNTNRDLTIFIGKREDNVYTLFFDELIARDTECLSMTHDDTYFWHH